MQQKNLDIYGNAPIPWSRVLAQLESRDEHNTCWLATAAPDGRPHIAGVGALWLDGKMYFTSGPATTKTRNLSHNPACAISMSLADVDVVIEGNAVRVTDVSTLALLAERYAAQGWPARVSGGALTAPYSAPSAGPPPWYLYAIMPQSAVAVATKEPNGATRWRFD